MKGKFGGFLAVLALAFIFCLPGMAMADLVANGGFETGTFAGWTATFPVESPPPLPLTFTVYGSPVNRSGVYGAYFGADGASGGYDTLTQAVTTVAGGKYALDFWLKHDFGTTGTDDGFKVSWNGTQNLLTLHNVPEFGWAEYTFTGLVATGVTSTIMFEGRDVPGGYFLDDVSVNAVPIPPTVLLFGSGILGIVGLGWRRRSGAKSAGA